MSITGSSIEWTGGTWNPTRGCTKVSPGCKNCYAERFAERFRGVVGNPFEQGFDPRLVPEHLVDPLKLSTSELIFVNSMSDLFHQDFSDDYIDKVCRVMEATPWHTYQVLTKRHDRLHSLLNGQLRFAAKFEHIWWGVSVEDRKYGLPRIDILRKTPAAVRFLSVEPLLEDLGTLDLSGIHWVIVGGESGPDARPIDATWVRSIRDQCLPAQVPFFFKQWGGVRKHKTGRVLDGRTWDEMPPVPAGVVPPRKDRQALAAQLGLRWR